jgi:hypothetical protein
MNQNSLQTSGRDHGSTVPRKLACKLGIAAGLLGLSAMAHSAEPQLDSAAAPLKLSAVLPLPLLQAAPAIQAAAVPQLDNWEISRADITISRALRRWGERAGYQVVWASPKDFPILASATFTGDFQDALRGVVESLAQSESPVMAVYYLNNVVQIVRYSGQAAELKGKN